MINNIQKSCFVFVVAIAAMLVWGSHPALAGQNGAGIWVYGNSTWSITVINLTDYPLTYLRSNEPGAYSYPFVANDSKNCGGHQQILGVGDVDWSIDPYRNIWWYGDRGCAIAPVFYSGRVTLYSTGFRNWAFDLVFADQAAHNLAERGFWVGLSPHTTLGPQRWANGGTSGTWAYGRWATPIDDKKMHNVMTLIGDEIMVALFSADNRNITVVVQQMIAVAWNGSAGNLVWDDEYTYKGNYLDFVDNDGSSVPGQ
jgi:hypothetical protein